MTDFINCKSTFSLCIGLLVLSFTGSSFAQEVDSLRLAKKHLSFGARYFKFKQYKQAEEHLLKAWQFDSDRGTTARYLGRLHEQLEQYEEAITWYEKSLVIDPDGKYTSTAYQGLTRVYMAKRKHDFARHHARRWTHTRPDDHEIHHLIMKLGLDLQDKILVQAENALRTQTTDIETLERLAEMLEERTFVVKAFEVYQRLNTLRPRNFTYLERLLKLGTQLNEPIDFRIKILDEMLKLQPQNERLKDLREKIRPEDPLEGKMLRRN